MIAKNRNDKSQRMFHRRMVKYYAQSDRVFSILLPAQWVFAIVCALLISPYVWEGMQADVHLHVWTATILGGLITLFPLLLIRLQPGELTTRLAVSCAQAMYSALLIHLMGGRIEAHFHVFASLGLLASYRDRMVLVPMVLLTALDHMVRGYLWPFSVFGAETVVPWRSLEHVAWVLFLTGGLWSFVGQARRQISHQVELERSLKRERLALERRVTERTEALSLAQKFYQCVLDSVDAHVCVMDPTGEITFVNDRWREFQATEDCNYRIEVGENYLQICDQAQGECRPTAQKVAQAVRDMVDWKRDSFSIEYELETSTGRRWFQVSLTPVEGMNERSIIVVHVDVNQLKRAQAKADSLAKLFMESPNEVFVLAKDDWKFVEVNSGALTNLGYSLNEMRQMTPIDILPNMEKSKFAALLQRVESARGRVLELESSYQRKDGSQYDCNIRLSSAMLEERPVYVAFVNDVTERVQLENRLRQSQKLESIGQLAAGIAHEINTPMQCVFSNVEFLHQSFERMMGLSDQFNDLLNHQQVDWESQRPELLKARQKLRYDYLRTQTPQALEEATEASNRVISIVRAMKVMSHPGTVQPAPADLNYLIQNAATITRNRWKYVARLETDLDPNVGMVELLPAEMSQVFINLMVNAADSISEKLGTEPEELGTIQVRSRRKGTAVQVEISDTGQGIKEDLKHRIFDPFFTTKDVGKGTGQGLALAYDIVVNKHGGMIDVESTPGKGATFFLSIPLEGFHFQDRSESSAVPSVEPEGHWESGAGQNLSHPIALFNEAGERK